MRLKHSRSLACQHPAMSAMICCLVQGVTSGHHECNSTNSLLVSECVCSRCGIVNVGSGKILNA